MQYIKDGNRGPAGNARRIKRKKEEKADKSKNWGSEQKTRIGLKKARKRNLVNKVKTKQVGGIMTIWGWLK